MNPNTALSPPSLILRAPFGSAQGLSLLKVLSLSNGSNGFVFAALAPLPLPESSFVVQFLIFRFTFRLLKPEKHSFNPCA